MSLSSFSRHRNRVKGALFEVIVRRLLGKAGYAPIKPDDIYVRKSDGKVRGRGYWHDIDALGRLSPSFWERRKNFGKGIQCSKSLPSE